MPFAIVVPNSIGTLGGNFFLPSAYLDLSSAGVQKDPMSIIFSLRAGVMPFRRVVLDLPHGRLGLDLASKPAEKTTAPAPAATAQLREMTAAPAPVSSAQPAGKIAAPRPKATPQPAAP